MKSAAEYKAERNRLLRLKLAKARDKLKRLQRERRDIDDATALTVLAINSIRRDLGE